MRWSGRKARRVLRSAGVAGALLVGGGALDAALEAQLAVDHRVARRGSSRATGRQSYVLPAGHTTVELSGATYYYAQGVYFEAVMKGGEVVYLVVDVN